MCEMEKGLLLVSLRWLYCLNNTSFLCVCLVAEKTRENFGHWNVGAWVLGYLVMRNAKGLLLVRLMWLYGLKNTLHLCGLFGTEKMREIFGGWTVRASIFG
jgi:hypothetical protein